MKQDKFEHIVKESLESVRPEVPEHLWENIRTQIPSAPSAESGGIEQGGAASTGTGTAGLLKVGAAAVLLVGGSALIWHLNSESDKDSRLSSSETPTEQKEQHAQNTSTESEDVYRLEETQDNAVQSENSAIVASEGEEPVEYTETTEAPVERNADAESENTLSENPSDSQESGDISTEKRVVNSNTSAGDAHELGVDHGTSQSERHAVAPNQVEENIEAGQEDVYEESHSEPIILVECGILANKVSGESPLTVQFSNVSKAKSYEWDFGNGRKSYNAEPMTTFDEAGDYTVNLTVTDFDGNRLTDQMEITVYEASTFFVPNAFSPNGDGLNDYFMVEGTNITNVSFEIFRLDGSLVYEGTSIQDKWDGSDSQQSGDGQYLVVTKYIRNDGTPDINKTMLSVIRE